MLSEYIVDKEHNNMRLDKFIRKYSKLEKLSEIFNCIKKGDIKINGRKRKENFRLSENDIVNYNDKIKLEIEKKDFLDLDTEELNNFKSMIVYEDDDIFIVNKSDNIAMHKGENHNYGLSEIAKKYYNNININFANRLDFKTSGLIIGSKKLEMLRIINKEIKNKKVIKKYIAMIISNELKIGDEFESKKPILINEKGVFIDKKGKEAHTKFKVIKVIKDRVILDINLLTGRKHQIRLHLKDLGFPIIGDEKYGGLKSNKLFLKCYFLEFLNMKFEIEKSF